MIASLQRSSAIQAYYLHDARKGGFLQIGEAAAEYLGLSENQLRDALRAGSSLAEIAGAQGKSTERLKSALLSVFPQAQTYEQLGADLERMMAEHPHMQARCPVDGHTSGCPAITQDGISGRSVSLVG